MGKKYVCSNDKSHQFDETTDDWLCPICPYGLGVLKDIVGDRPEVVDTPVIEIEVGDVSGAGLCVLVMDASGSMQETAFPDNPSKKRTLVAGSAAHGIFDLKTMTKADKAYIFPVLFDEDVMALPIKTVAQMVSEFQTPENLKQYFIKNFDTMRGATDINKALKFAKDATDSALNNGDLSKFGGPKSISFDTDSILPSNGGNPITVPKVRVMIYTDGGDTENSKVVNPFAGGNADILMGAYFGPGKESGCKKLEAILSKCPRHDFDQFFLINSPDRIQTLKNLFRMASGATGFCPLCLAENQTGGIRKVS